MSIIIDIAFLQFLNETLNETKMLQQFTLGHE